MVAYSRPTLCSDTRAEAAPFWCGPLTPWLINKSAALNLAGNVAFAEIEDSFT